MKPPRYKLIEVKDLQVKYRSGAGLLRAGTVVTAVDGVSLEIAKGETLGLVGESGSGKSTLGRSILRLIEPAAGTVHFDGDDLTALTIREMRERRRRMQMIFQDPYSSLNPRMTASQTIGEPLRVFGMARGSVRSQVGELLETVGLSGKLGDRYPAEFSGGQRQRIAIARALAAGPDFIIADEPLSSLDVSIQAQIMNLLRRLQRERELTYLFISHDLRAVRHLSDRIAVMYLGKIVETGPAEDLYTRPLMPYTKALLSAAPPSLNDKQVRDRIVLRGEVPSPIAPPSGCSFHTRCPWAIEECSRFVPALQQISSGHYAACIRISPGRPNIEATT